MSLGNLCREQEVRHFAPHQLISSSPCWKMFCFAFFFAFSRIKSGSSSEMLFCKFGTILSSFSTHSTCAILHGAVNRSYFMRKHASHRDTDIPLFNVTHLAFWGQSYKHIHMHTHSIWLHNVLYEDHDASLTFLFTFVYTSSMNHGSEMRDAPGLQSGP